MPESALLGVATPLIPGATQIGGVDTLQANGNNFPERAAYRVESTGPGQQLHRFFRRTGLLPGAAFGKRGWYLATGQQSVVSIENSGASGGECDKRDENSPLNIEVLASGQNSGPNAEMTYYDRGGGGFVFSVGSISFGGSVVIDEDLQQILYNALDECLGWLDVADTLYAAIWQESDGAPWEARHGMSRNDFQATIDTLSEQGYRLVSWSGYSVLGEDRHAAVWEQRPGPPSEEHYLLTADEFQEKFDELLNMGYQLVRVFGYTPGDEVLFAGLWELRPSPGWQARHGITADEYQQIFDELVAQGYRLIYLSAFGIGDGDRYCAIWEQSEGPAWEARRGLRADEFQHTFDELLGEGYRLVHVWGYAVGSEDRYAAIWEQSAGPAWVARHRLTASAYQRTFNQLLDQGYRPVVVSGFRVGA